jgi:hypothetical protein
MTALDHRRRMLAHQEKTETERRLGAVTPIDPQLRMPLVAEVRNAEPTATKSVGRRTNKAIQLKIKGV